MDKPSTTIINTAAVESLSPLPPMLSAFNHRHRNQHRSSHWWPIFRILRRSIDHLIEELTPLPAASSSLLSRRPPPPKRDTTAPPRHPLLPHSRYLNNHVLPRAYLAFSQLAADNQYAPLGLFLLAVLARTNAVVANLLSHGEKDANLQTNPRKTTEKGKPANNDVGNTGALDTGVSISRQDLRSVEHTAWATATKQREDKYAQDGLGAGPGDSAPEKETVQDNKSERKEKRKKKKKGDALSSLFSSLS